MFNDCSFHQKKKHHFIKCWPNVELRHQTVIFVQGLSFINRFAFDIVFQIIVLSQAFRSTPFPLRTTSRAPKRPSGKLKSADRDELLTHDSARIECILVNFVAAARYAHYVSTLWMFRSGPELKLMVYRNLINLKHFFDNTFSKIF